MLLCNRTKCAQVTVFFTVFAEDEKYVEALGAFVADKVVGWHDFILAESGSEVERGRKALP